MKKITLHAAAVGFAIAVFLLLAAKSNLLTRVENILWDAQVQLFADPAEHRKDIKLILIDQNSLDWAQKSNGLQWPWPREVYKVITDFCRNSGAKLLVFDMIFSENSVYGVDDDRHFAAALKEMPSVGAMIVSNSQGSVHIWPKTLKMPLQGHKVSVDDTAAVTPFKQATFSVDTISNGFGMLASVYATVDIDGIVRRSELLHSFDGTLVPSVALASYMATHKDEILHVARDSLTIGSKKIALDKHNAALINYRGKTQTHETINAAAVIRSQLLMDEGKEPLLDPDIFKESYVFLGVSAPGLMDFKSTPLSRIYPGVEVHATLLDNILGNDFFSRPPLWSLFFILFFLSAFTFFLTRLKHSFGTAITLFAGMALLSALLSAAAYELNYRFPLSLLLLALFFASLGAFTMNYLIEGAQRRYIKNAFGQYLSPAVIETLIGHPEKLKLGGELQPLSIFFSDIQGFTSIAQKMQPSLLPAFLNDYLSVLSDIILEEGGTIDKYEGDAVIAFWNAPVPQQDHALRAVRAALRCQKATAALQEHFISHCGSPILTRIGINTGDAVVGNMGTKKRFDYTFIGDAGNLAARLESANKQFGTYMMISESTKELLGDAFRFRELGLITVVGRSEPVRVFEPYFPEEYEAKSPLLKRFTEALELFYRGELETAYRHFEAIAQDDPPAQHYLGFIDDKKKEVGFDAVLRLSSK